MKVLVNEFAKMRRLRVGAVAGLLLLGLVGLTAFQTVLSPDPGGDGGDHVWRLIFGNLGFAMVMVPPLLLAVLASRQVEMEHSGNGWLLSATSGVTPGRLCRAKFAALGCLVVAATALASLLLVALGLALDAGGPVPVGHWVGFTASAAVVNLAVLAFQVLLSAKVENQLVCLGAGIAGIFLGVFAEALPAWVNHLTPWGYYSLISPADFVGGELVYLDISYAGVFALAVVGGALFLAATARFDRQEA